MPGGKPFFAHSNINSLEGSAMRFTNMRGNDMLDPPYRRKMRPPMKKDLYDVNSMVPSTPPGHSSVTTFDGTWPRTAWNRGLQSAQSNTTRAAERVQAIVKEANFESYSLLSRTDGSNALSGPERRSASTPSLGHTWPRTSFHSKSASHGSSSNPSSSWASRLMKSQESTSSTWVVVQDGVHDGRAGSAAPGPRSATPLPAWLVGPRESYRCGAPSGRSLCSWVPVNA
mmetsp:Transcript_95838/g.256134  ORF Transcript_95838/g.256134 Transcript_95838/m.256134 type:complete len:228 (+) Transcript_95838:84-767(+)